MAPWPGGGYRGPNRVSRKKSKEKNVNMKKKVTDILWGGRKSGNRETNRKTLCGKKQNFNSKGGSGGGDWIVPSSGKTDTGSSSERFNKN